jgi:uncharacterized protein (TIGR02453 family)
MPQPMPTAHFSPALFDFLRELSKHNDRRWFEANRERYEADVRGPLLRFVADLVRPLQRLCPDYVVDPRPAGGSMFRINRDVRFSRDKSPYKTQVGLHFYHRHGPKGRTAGFCLHMEPGEAFSGAGIWHPEPPALAAIRAGLVSDPRGWRRATGGAAFRGASKLWGESLVRAPRGFPPDHPLAEDLRRKDFVAARTWTEKEATSRGFLERYAQFCRATLPLNAWLAGVLDLR